MTPEERKSAIKQLDADIASVNRAVQSSLVTASHMRYDDYGAALFYLERAVKSQKVLVRLAAQRKALYEPCRACGRRVSSPCHDAEGYYESGPWDGSCVELLRGR